jgi:hypothetical protein
LPENHRATEKRKEAKAARMKRFAESRSTPSRRLAVALDCMVPTPVSIVVYILSI